MADMDTSMYRFVPPPDPTEQISKWAGLRHQMGENQLQGQELAGRAALGNAIKASTNPDGSINTNLLTRTLANDPNGARLALDAQQQSQHGNQLTGYLGRDAQGRPQQMQAPLPQVMGMGSAGQQAPQLPQDQIDALHDHTDALINTLGPLSQDDNLDNKKIIRGVTDLVADPNAQFTPQDAATTLSGIPHGQNGADANPQQLKAVVSQKFQQVQQQKAVLSQHYPSSAQLAHAKESAAGLSSGTPAQANSEPQQVAQETAPQQQPAQIPQQQQAPGQGGSPGTATAPPLGYEENMHKQLDHFDQIRRDADSAPQTEAVLSNIYNLSKSGAPTGTINGKLYQYLAEKGFATKDITDKAAQLQEITKAMHQIALSAGMPDSDKRLNAVEGANTNPEQLPQTVQNLIPFLRAVNQTKIEKFKYYNKAAGDGTNPNAVQNADLTWAQHFDPRILEMKQLSSDPAELKKYTAGMTKDDKNQLLEKYQNAKKYGIVGE